MCTVIWIRLHARAGKIGKLKMPHQQRELKGEVEKHMHTITLIEMEWNRAFKSGIFQISTMSFSIEIAVLQCSDDNLTIGRCNFGSVEWKLNIV